MEERIATKRIHRRAAKIEVAAGQARTVKLRARATEEERTVIVANAEQVGLTYSEFARRVLLSYDPPSRTSLKQLRDVASVARRVWEAGNRLGAYLSDNDTGNITRILDELEDSAKAVGAILESLGACAGADQSE